MGARLVIGSALALLAGSGLAAHEIGTTRVLATIDGGGGYTVEIVTDALSLAQKIAAASGVEVPDGSSASQLESLLSAHDALFRQRVQLVFDGVEAQPAIRYSVRAGSSMAVIHLAGKVPSGALQFTWKYGWTFASYSMTVRNTSSSTTEWLEGDQVSAPFSRSPMRPSVPFAAWRYLRLGFTHIVPMGLDHMLFVVGIFLLSGRPRPVLAQISAFTVAHSITLGLAMYGLVSVAPRVVEPMIAISIAYVAIENIVLKDLKAWRILLVFAFGLLHGMGFAGALKEIGLPRSQFLAALLTFNIGVEAGQLSVILVAFLLVGWQFSGRSWYRSRVVVPASAAIACTAVYWTIQRIVT